MSTLKISELVSGITYTALWGFVMMITTTVELTLYLREAWKASSSSWLAIRRECLRRILMVWWRASHTQKKWVIIAAAAPRRQRFYLCGSIHMSVLVWQKLGECFSWSLALLSYWPHCWLQNIVSISFYEHLISDSCEHYLAGSEDAGRASLCAQSCHTVHDLNNLH